MPCLASLGMIAVLAGCSDRDARMMAAFSERAADARACSLILATAHDAGDSLHRLRLPLNTRQGPLTSGASCAEILTRDTLPPAVRP